MRRQEPVPTVSAADEAHSWLRPLGPNPKRTPLRIKAARASAAPAPRTRSAAPAQPVRKAA